jgi:hypothetical protein
MAFQQDGSRTPTRMAALAHRGELGQGPDGSAVSPGDGRDRVQIRHAGLGKPSAGPSGTSVGIRRTRARWARRYQLADRAGSISRRTTDVVRRGRVDPPTRSRRDASTSLRSRASHAAASALISRRPGLAPYPAAYSREARRGPGSRASDGERPERRRSDLLLALRACSTA